MLAHKNIKNRRKNIIIVAGLLIILIGLFWIVLTILIGPLCIPVVFDFVFGDKVTSEHLNEIAGNQTNSTVIAQKLVDWIANSKESPYGEKKYLEGIQWSISNVSGHPRFFIKTTKASWVIYSKLGNCGEDAWYFVGMMNKAGFRSRTISLKGEDHGFAEYYDENNRRIVIDPSGFLSKNSTNDSYAFSIGRQWSYVIATDLNGNTEDVTNEYVLNTSVLAVNTPDTTFLSKRSSVIINSMVLVTDTGMYTNPQELIAHDVSDTNNFTIILGEHEKYQLIKRVNLYLIFFEEKESLDLRTDKTILLIPSEIIKLENVKPTVFGAILLGVAELVVVIKLFCLTKKWISIIIQKKEKDTKKE